MYNHDTLLDPDMNSVTTLLMVCMLLTSGCRPGKSSAEDPLRIAVASNFAAPMNALSLAFTDSTGYGVVLSSGSSGRLYAQLRNGAPHDLFFSADSERPRLLEADPLVAAQSRVTYAVGRLALWDPMTHRRVADGAALQDNDVRYIAMANPELAPYGVAARDVLIHLGLWESLQDKLVRGENIAQTYQFGRTGNADLAFVARSQMKPSDHFWLVPDSLHEPVLQQAVRMTDHPHAADFLYFVQGQTGQRIIRTYGYETQ